MATVKAVIIALVSVLSVATAHTPLHSGESTELSAWKQALTTTEELSFSSRVLTAKKKCRTRPFAQCGGRGLKGRRNGIWRCCPKGFYCKKYNYWWWSCQKKRSRRKSHKNKRKSKKSKKKSKKRNSRKSKGGRRRSNNDNRRVRDGSDYNPNDVDPCSMILPQMKQNSHWCAYPKIIKRPSRPGLKVDRSTVYSGPVMKQLGYCGRILEGDADKAAVAISTKYLAKDGWAFGTDKYCGRCICMQYTGNDYYVNPTPQPPSWKNYVGLTFKAVVRDMCPECTNDAIDVLMDRGYSKAPPTSGNDMSYEANKRPGIRPMDVNVAMSVGVWTIQWDFLDSCSDPCTKDFFDP